MLKNLDKAPFPWFGGKRNAAPLIWERLGDVGHFVDPFMGSLVALLLRPHQCNRAYFSETVNDIDGMLVNAWRAIQMHPDETADAAAWPVSEADLHARHMALVRWKAERNIEHLMGDPEWCHPKMAGWWIWGQSCWIGSGWCSGKGPWIVDADGRITKRQSKNPGVKRQRPQLTNDQGVNHAGAREPGAWRQRPHLTDDDQGVNHARAREPGVSRQLPHISDNGQGVNHADAREPEPEFHPMTMPEILRWFNFLSARLRHVRIINGPARRLMTHGATITLSVDEKNPCGVLLDPPYSAAVRESRLYAHEDAGDLAAECREWCAKHGADPLYRIALCGFVGEGHEALVDHGWTEEEWYEGGFLRGGYGEHRQI